MKFIKMNLTFNFQLKGNGSDSKIRLLSLYSNFFRSLHCSAFIIIFLVFDLLNLSGDTFRLFSRLLESDSLIFIIFILIELLNLNLLDVKLCLGCANLDCGLLFFLFLFIFFVFVLVYDKV